MGNDTISCEVIITGVLVQIQTQYIMLWEFFEYCGLHYLKYDYLQFYDESKYYN